MNIFRHVSAICQGNGLQEIISLFGFRNENTKTVKPTFYFWNRPAFSFRLFSTWKLDFKQISGKQKFQLAIVVSVNYCRPDEFSGSLIMEEKKHVIKFCVCFEFGAWVLTVL